MRVNFKNSTGAVALLIVALIFFGSCKKDEKGGTITVKGRLMQSCNGPAISGISLRVAFRNPGWGGSSDDNIGSGVTGADGSFEIVCKNLGEGQITVSHDVGPNTNVPFIKDYQAKVKNGETIDFGTVYYSLDYGAAIKFVFDGPLAGDTLFFGRTEKHPADTIVATDGSPYVYSYWFTGDVGYKLPYISKNTYVWGKGIVDYNQAADLLWNDESSTYHRIDYKVTICGTPDTTVVSIP